MNKTISSTTYKALQLIYRTSRDSKWIKSAKEFASLMWGDDPTKEHLFNSLSNQGNGACMGKKAWLQAGSFLGKLRKRGYITRTSVGYMLRLQGGLAMKEYKQANRGGKAHEKDQGNTRGAE